MKTAPRIALVAVTALMLAGAGYGAGFLAGRESGWVKGWTEGEAWAVFIGCGK